MVVSDAEFRASHSSSESDDGDEEDFSSEADSFDVGHANKKKVEKHAKVTKNTTTKSAAGGKGKPRKKETKASGSWSLFPNICFIYSVYCSCSCCFFRGVVTYKR